jgi:putative flippase GtrA
LTRDETLNQPAATAATAAAVAPVVPAIPQNSAASGGALRRLHAAVDVVYREMVKFGAVGLLAFVVDLYVYNVLRTGVWPVDDAPLHDKPLLSKVISVAVATVVAWLGNRYWTFRHRRRSAPRAEFVLFVVMNIGGLAIALGCLWFSHYLLDLTSPLADNISGNVIGLGLGTLFRFWAYRQFVFTELRATSVPDPT